MDPSARVRTAVVAVVGCATAVYGVTVDPAVIWGDSGELALQAHRLGVTHPPGYPLHSFLGHLAAQVMEPVTATTLLSLTGTLLAAGMLAALAAATAGFVAGVVAGLVFSLHPLVWSAAIRTEVYNVNMALVALALAALVWPGTLSRRQLAIAIAFFALSFGTSPANVLLVPGVVALLVARSPEWGTRGRRLAALIATLLASACALTAWTMFRSRVHPPLGTPALPDTLAGFLRFVSGADYDVLAVHGPRFYLGRTLTTATEFLADFAWVGGALALVGLARQWRVDRGIAIGLALVVAGNLGYFTYHPWPDYRTMMTPSYFVFSLWAGTGAAAVAGWVFRARWRPAPARHLARAGAVLLIGIVPAVVAVRAQRYEDEHRIPEDPKAFVEQAFAVAPPEAVVLTSWIYFTPLLYAQEVHGLRPDLRIVEVADGPRHHGDRRAATWNEVAMAAAGDRPVVTNIPAVVTRTGWRAEPLGERWRILIPD